MNAATILDRIQTPDTHIDGRTVVVAGVPQGLLVPSLFIAKPDEHGRTHVYGSKGVGACDVGDPESVWAALIATGGVLFGTPDDIQAVTALLAAPRTSRTVSYLCAIAPDCGAVARAIARLAESRVLVLGAGGIGSMISMVLAGSGVGHVTFCDGDVVEASNLNRQFFYGPSDVGRKKVSVLAEAISARYPDVQARAVDGMVDLDNLPDLMRGMDMVVIGADEPPHLASDAARLAHSLGIDSISCGYVHAEGALTFLSHRAERIEPDSTVQWMRVAGGAMPSFGPANVELAGIASSTVVLNLCGLLSAAGDDLQNKWPTYELPRRWHTDV